MSERALLPNKLFNLFKRRTSGSIFIPEIDGLRFVAIFLVVITHIQSLYLSRSGILPSNKWQVFFHNFLDSGDSGVLIFFVISGFILILPFARQHLLTQKKVSIKKYYLRRITRLEPPYLLVMIALFLLKIPLQNQNFNRLLPHLGASLAYSHWTIYHELSKITPITWSLEIEMRFYLLAPFLAAIYRLPKINRRIIIFCLICILPFMQSALSISRYTFLGTFQYFLTGFLLVDLYLCHENQALKKNFQLLGVLFLFLLVFLNPVNLLDDFFYPFFIFGLFYLALNNFFWRKLFQNKLLTSIGGMCYSIYLLHFALISFFGKGFFSLSFTQNFYLKVLLQVFICLPLVLLFSSIYYLLVEKPCMDPDWPVKLVRFLKNIKLSLRDSSLSSQPDTRL